MSYDYEILTAVEDIYSLLVFWSILLIAYLCRIMFRSMFNKLKGGK